MKNNENGRSMIEMLGVLAIIGVLSVGGIAGYSKAMSKYRTNKVIEQATYLITNIRTMFAQQQSYADLNNARAVNLQLVPEEMIVNPEKEIKDNAVRRLRNVFSGSVSISNSAIDAMDATEKQGAFKVTFLGLSRDACIQIATSDWGAGSSSGLVGMHIWNAGTAGDTAAVAGQEGSKDAQYDDTVIEKIYKVATAQRGSDATLGDGNGIAVPGDATYKVPFTVMQAQVACACANKTTCAVTWKYY